MGLTIRYVPTTTRMLKPEMAAPFLLRGKPVPASTPIIHAPAISPAIHMAFTGCEEWK